MICLYIFGPSSQCIKKLSKLDLLLNTFLTHVCIGLRESISDRQQNSSSSLICESPHIPSHPIFPPLVNAYKKSTQHLPTIHIRYCKRLSGHMAYWVRLPQPICEENSIMEALNFGCNNDKGDAQLPSRFKFHPTDEDLIIHYLMRKVLHKKLQ